MTKPCRSDCPQGDCAGCVFPPARLPARCTPADCAQRAACARSHFATTDAANDIDASGCKTARGWCPMFIDARGAALLEIA